MSSRKTSSKTTSKRRVKRAPNSFDRQALIRASSLRVPKTLTTKPQAEYEAILSWDLYSDAGATSTTFQTVSTNSLVPFTTGATYNTRLATLGRAYTKYRVVAYRYTIEILSRAATADGYAMIANTASTDNAPATGSSLSSSVLIADRLTQTTMVPAINKTNSKTTVSGRYFLETIIGSPDFKIDESYAGTFNTSGVASPPSTLTYMYIASGPTTGAWTASEAPRFMTRFVQDTIFFAPRNQ